MKLVQLLMKNLKVEPVVLKEDGPDWTNELDVQVDEKLAPKFYLRKISNVKIGESPLWMQKTPLECRNSSD